MLPGSQGHLSHDWTSHLVQGVFRVSKYHSRKITRDGEVFDRVKEYRRWCELKLLEMAGEITDLKRQVPFELIPAQYEHFERYSEKTGKRLKDGKRCVEQSVVYNADFVYNTATGRVVEDTKGYRKGTAYDVFAIKRKLMLWVHGIRIQEV